MTHVAALLPGNRLHLHHGPIDLVIGCDGDHDAAFAAAEARFSTILNEITQELPLLRQPVGNRPKGVVAQQMYDASLPHTDGLTTPMICIAGSVAQEVLAAMTSATDLTRAYVNNGGDIALHLADGAVFDVGVASPSGKPLSTLQLTSNDTVRGIATSGQQGRSLSLGIASSVTVLATTAAMADAAATKIANTVDLPDHPAILRTPANEIRDDTDLGDTPIVTHVGALSEKDASAALALGRAKAQALIARGLIQSAALFLRDQTAVAGCIPLSLSPTKELSNA